VAVPDPAFAAAALGHMGQIARGITSNIIFTASIQSCAKRCASIMVTLTASIPSGGKILKSFKSLVRVQEGGKENAGECKDQHTYVAYYVVNAWFGFSEDWRSFATDASPT
jgi:hypothetical protein